ncbi:MAG: hypothetical protein OXE86_20515 [Alphaproteobacteria bacterium]|nr:hypothetical protein [Alphaproteobacteria bacterium]
MRPSLPPGARQRADTLSPAQAAVFLRGIYVGASALAQDLLDPPLSVALALMTTFDDDVEFATVLDPSAAWFVQLRSVAGGVVAEWNTGIPGPGGGGPSTRELAVAGFVAWEGPADAAGHARWLADIKPSGRA